MTTTPQAALLSEAERCAKNLNKWNANDDCWSPEHIRARSEAELRRLDALVAHLTADRDDTANELALRTKHNLALTNERDQLLARLQATQEPAQAGGLPDEREAFIHWMTTTYPDVYTQDKAEHYWAQEHVSRLAWQAATARAALSARKPLNSAQIRGMAIQEEFLLVCDSLEDLTCIVREVERAHGIGLEVKP